MSKVLKHYTVLQYSGSSGWWHSENLSVREWVNKIDHNMNSLCQLGRGAHIRYFFFFFFLISQSMLKTIGLSPIQLCCWFQLWQRTKQKKLVQRHNELTRHDNTVWQRLSEEKINPLRPNFFRGNRNIYLHFMSFLHIDMTQAVEIIPQVREKVAYPT